MYNHFGCEIPLVDNLLNNLFSFHQMNAIIPEFETSAEGAAEPERQNKDLSTIAKRHLCALRLLTHFFSKEQLAESNTDGSHDKRGLDSVKLSSLKILIFSNFAATNSKERDKAWRIIKGKINSKYRIARKSFKLPDSTSL